MKAKKSIKPTKPLGQRQLLGMKRKSLDKRILSYYEATHDVSSVVEYLVVVLLRDALILQDLSFMCEDLIRQLFMVAEPNDTLRKFCSYFKAFFTSDEWNKQVKKRLFRNEAAYVKASEEARRYSELLNTPGTGEVEHPDHRHDLVTIFEDANGKKHRLTIRNTHESLTKAEIAQRLEILTTLTILKTDSGVRRFVRFIDVDRNGMINTFKEEPVEEEREESGEISDTISKAEESVEQVIEIVAPEGMDIDALALSEEQLLALVQAAHPNIRSLKNIRVVFIEKDPEEQEALEEEIPIPDKQTQGNFGGQETASTKKESSSTAVADPPPAKTKQRRPRNRKEAYISNLVRKAIAKTIQSNGESKKGKDQKKNDDQSIPY